MRTITNYQPMVKKRSLLTLAAFLSLAANGMILTSMGTSLPSVQSFLDINIEKSGTLMASLQAGFTVFSLIAGILSDSLQRERILFTGCILLALSSFLFCTSQLYTINLIVVFIMGAGIGTILSGSNTMLISLYPEKKGSILNIHHIFFGLGSLCGPLLMGYLIIQGNWWKEGFAGQGVFLLILALFFLVSGGEKPHHPESYSFRDQVERLIRDKHFWVLLLVNGLSMGAQVTILLLGVTYLIEAKSSSLPAAGLALSLFSVCMMVGRLICSRLTVQYTHATIILSLLWLQLIALALVWYLPGLFSVVFLILSGFTFSGIYPTALALAGALFPEVAGSALGILSTVGGLGTIILCWLTGYVASLIDMKTSFIVIILASLIAVVLFQIIFTILRTRENT